MPAKLVDHVGRKNSIGKYKQNSTEGWSRLATLRGTTIDELENFRLPFSIHHPWSRFLSSIISCFRINRQKSASRLCFIQSDSHA